MKKPLPIILALLLLTTSAYFGYTYWQNNKPNPTTSSTSQTTDPSEGGKYLVIKEWGIRLPADPAFKGLSYEYMPSHPGGDAGTVQLKTGLQDELPADCKTSLASAWSFVRYNGSDPSPVPGDEEQHIKVKDSQHIPNNAMRRVGEYAYRRIYPQLACPAAHGLDLQIDQLYKQAFTSFAPY